MKRIFAQPSRIVAYLASVLTAISSLTLAPLPAQAADVVSSSGNCVATVDNTSGVVSYSDGLYCYVAFKSTGITYNWTRPSGITAFDFVIVAGGGGGGTRHGGGGGAGGLIQATAQTITGPTISISVGAGGAGGAASQAGTGVGGSSGSNSVVTATGFTTQTAIGGGAGMQASSGLNGGSGGGGSCCSGTGGTGTPGQGNNGSLGWTGSGYYLGGAGGGAGSAATNANSSTYVAGVGGAGAPVSWINSTVQTALGVGVFTSGATYFAGGGGGGTAVYGTAGAGGSGGGGAGGAVSTAGTNGTANTGGGGGGGGMFVDNSVPAGGNGASGVVLFRYVRQPLISWNASDVNSYEETVSTTAINDLSPASNYDGILYNGSNGVAPGFDRTTGAWTFTGGLASAGPYAKVSSNISTTPFNSGGVTIDFEADFGTTANNWERIIDFSSNAAQSDNLLVARRDSSNDLITEVYNGNSSFGYCTLANAISPGMTRWTIRLDGTSCIFYKNGVQQQSTAYTGKPASGATWTNAFIARSNWSNDQSLEGSIRSLRLYAGGLSPAEMPAPVTKTVTLNAYDGNAQNGGGVTNNMQSPRLTTGSVRLPTPITRAGYTFMGWFNSLLFDTKVGDAGGVYTPSSSITLYGGWRTSIDSSVLGNLVFNFDATHIGSLPSAATSANSIYPASSRIAALGLSSITRDTVDSPGAALFPNGLGANVINFGANNATNISGALSFETWFKCSALRSGASWNIIASHWFSDTAGNGTRDWHFAIYNDRLQVDTHDGTSQKTAVGSKVWSSSDCGKWYLVGFTLDASGNLQMYINGRTDGSLQTGMTHNANASPQFWIGDGRASSARIQGYISRVRLYNSSLTSSQMLNNFSGEATTYGMGPYTLTYSAGPNGTGANVVETYNAGASATLRNNTAPFNRAGYYISGWTTSSASGGAQTNALSSSVTMDANLVLYPVWTATSYTITYNYNGADGGNSTASSTYAGGGTPITLPTPTKTNYTFGGWYAAADFSGSAVTGTQTPSSNYTLYAKWNLATYTLTFVANDGAATANVTQTVTHGVATALRTNTFTKSRATFARWSDLASGLSLNSWTDGQSFTATANTTFYAIWNNEARIIFDSNGGSAVADAYTVGQPLAGATPLAKPTDPTKAGKIFGGWSTLVDNGNGVATSIVTWPRDYEVNSTETLYAIWLDACAPTRTIFTGSGTTDLTSSTYGNSGVTYVQFRFNTVGSCAWTVPNEVTALDVLLVGGGGAGSYFGRAGGGGAGTLLHTSTSYTTSAGTNIPISVGAGGLFVYNGTDGSRGLRGAPSAFANIIADGGGAGAGGAGTLQAASAGGSGGGAACIPSFTSGGAGVTPIYSGWSGYASSGGNAAANCTTGSALYGAGGGGAGGVGNSNSTGGAALTRFGVQLAGGGAGWLASTTAQGGGTVGGDWNTTGCDANTSTNNGAVNTGSGGASCGSGGSGTVIVRFVAPTYTTTYSYNGATGGATIPSTNSVGNGLTLPTPTKTGYVFGGWYADSGFTTSVGAGGASFTPTSDSTIYAKWNGGTSVLTYEYNGATAGNTTVSSSYTSGGTAITLPTPTKTGYTFGGWYREANFTTSVTGTQTPTADATLYAKWTAINYSLTYSSTLSSSGTVPTDSTNYNIGSVANVQTNSGNLARTGYTFAGWTVASDGSGSVLTSGQTVTFATANITLYAKWTANTYTISYNVNGATGTQANASDSYTTGGSAVTLSAVGTMAKIGHNFSGWSATPTGSVIAGTYTTTSDVTLYAIWTIQVISVTYDKGTAASASFISFPANTSGNYGTRITVSNNIDSSVTYSSNTYAFVGWTDGTSMYQAGQQYLLGTSNVTLTAVWVQAFGVRYIVNGGTFANGTSTVDAECLVVGNLCTNGQTVTANAAPTRPGYTFTGWTDQSSNAIAAGATFTVNINSYLLYAGWTANNYSITYAPNGGSTTPTQSALHYGDTFTLANAISRTGYNFNGWNDGTTTYGAGTTYTVGLSNVTLTAQWTPLTYVITYDWNGGIGSATANSTYTVGNSGLLLPVVGDHVKDGFNFGGWSLTNGGFAVTAPFIPTGSATLYAIWGSGSYTINYDLNYGAQASSATTVANGNSTVLPTPARSNFVFDGWYTAATGGSKVGNAGANFTPGGSSTLYARWIQASLYGVIGNLNRISTITASDSVSSSYNGTAGGSSVSVTVPSATLPAGTVVALDVITDTTYAQSLLTGNNNYILSIAVSWLAPNETVPDTNSGKAVSMTITNNSIRAGALVYSIQNGVVTLLGTATQNGTITVQLTSDPSVYVVATVPTVPQTIASTQTSTSATVTWSAPSSDGGSAITGYTVTLNTGATCNTTLLTCTFNNLTAGTSYTASVVASNTIGSSVVGTVTFTPTAAPSGGNPAPVTPTPPVVVPPKPTEPVTPVVPVVVPVPLAQAIEKILSNNVPVLAGTPVVAPILFNPYSAKLDAKDIARIKTAADALKDKAGWLFVTGFVKYEGAGTRLEKNLAKARATAVAKQMAKFGLRVKIGYLGYGAPNKLAPKPTDRKVELRWQAEPSQNS